MTFAALRTAQDRVCEAAILLATGASAEAIADALLRALEQLDELERTVTAGGLQRTDMMAP
jgi:hypothetical protein